MKRPLLRSIVPAGAALAFAMHAGAADIDVPRIISASETWTADNVYFLDGYTFVDTLAGAAGPTVLTIEAGTVIKARESLEGGEASALVITAGAQIQANGTKWAPIIFTSELDDLDGSLGPADTNLWGGLVVLGNAQINSRADSNIVTAPVIDQIEGFAVAGGETELISFGGTDDAESSGSITYVSIRHGGAVLGTANEINGLTLGGVGSGTTIEYVEIFANKDDGIEFFGGTVDVKYAVTAFGKDDGFDYDQGWRGRGQFWVTIGTDSGEAQDKGGEHDGATAPLNATPVGGTTVFNATFVGVGAGGAANTALNIRDNAISKYYNSVFVDFASMLNVEADNADRLAAGDVDFANNVWWSHIPANNNAAAFDVGALDVAYFWTETVRDNVIADPLLAGISRTNTGLLDLRPTAGSPALVGPFATVPTTSDNFYVQTSYKGAFAADESSWLYGWTKLSTEGYLAASASGSGTRLGALSTRCFVGTGDNAAIPGFTIAGTESRTVLIRAVGTDGLSPLQVPGTLADPKIDLVLQGTPNTTVGSNDNWGDAANFAEIKNASAAVFAFSIPEDGNDAAMLVTLVPGSYTIVTTGTPDTDTGVVIVEIYEVQ